MKKLMILLALLVGAIAIPGCQFIKDALKDSETGQAVVRYQAGQDAVTAWEREQIELIEARLGRGEISDEDARLERITLRATVDSKRMEYRVAFNDYLSTKGVSFNDSPGLGGQVVRATRDGLSAWAVTGNILTAIITAAGTLITARYAGKQDIAKNNLIRDKSRVGQDLWPAEVVM